MATALTIAAHTRTEMGKRAKHLLAQGLIPAVVYGHGTAAQNLRVSGPAFLKVYRAAGESSLVDLVVENALPVKVLIQDIQIDPVRGDVIHVDFREVRMDEKLEADINLRFVGESSAVKEMGGILVKNFMHLKVRCLPSALVHEIVVDLSSLKAFGDKLHVRDVVVPPGIEVLVSADETVVLVEEPRSEEELKTLEAAPEAAAVEGVKVIADEKKEERAKAKEEAGEPVKDGAKKEAVKKEGATKK